MNASSRRLRRAPFPERTERALTNLAYVVLFTAMGVTLFA